MAVTFNDTTNKQGLYQHLLFLSGQTEASFPIADATRLLNFALDRYTYLSILSSGDWQFDDFGNSTFARARRSLASGQQDYSMQVDYLTVERVEIQDEDGVWHKLDQFDENDIADQSLNDYKSTDGTPQYYDIVNNSIVLYPAPDYSRSEALELTYKRPFNHFSTSDTTASINIPSIHSEYLVLHALSRSTLRSNDVNMNHVRQDVADYERMIKDGLSRRDRDIEHHLAPKINVKK